MAPTRPQPVTQADKLRAMSNLQSEITRRARSLRAEYARLAQGLRSKLEMRLYRIPKAMRKANMGELLQKYIELQEDKGKQTVAVKSPLKESSKSVPAAALASASPEKSLAVKKTTRTKATTAQANVPKPVKAVGGKRPKGVKRTSEIVIAADNSTDKENEAIENPKKKTKVGADTAPTRSVRDPNTILSPKSNNSRTLPQSPIRHPFGVPAKGFASRPASPLKLAAGPPSPVRQPTVPRPTTAASTTRATATRATKATTASTRAAPARGAAKAGTRTTSNSSNVSNATTGTTIVRKGATSRAGTAASTAKKTTATASTAASARRTAAAKAKAEATPAETGTRRVLRKRG